jgi:methionyl-tRNA formyltransferase
VNDEAFRQWVQEQTLDVALMAGFRNILKQATLEAMPSCINFHPSLLPAYRGPRPGFWVIKNGEAKTGVTAHVTTPQIDEGLLVAQHMFSLSEEDTLEAVEARLASTAAQLLPKVLHHICTGDTQSTFESLVSFASYYKRPDIKDCTIHSGMSQQMAINIIRACGHSYQPYFRQDKEVIPLEHLTYAKQPQGGFRQLALTNGNLWVKPKV